AEEASAPEESVKKEKKPATSRFGRKAKKLSEDNIDDDITSFSDIDDDDDDDEIPDRPARRSSFRRSKSSESSGPRIVSMSRSSRNAAGMEVRVCRPSDFDSCQDISDIILSGKAAVINFDLVSLEDAQRIIDFVSGCCYAINGTVKQIADKIVIYTPNDIDITGDFLDAASSKVTVPAFDFMGEDL
ncbi:MAG: cell division protein SepF, partial [Solobacterium sp.]|nr:cell division protein SepF [Solobacterium sp.]